MRHCVPALLLALLAACQDGQGVDPVGAALVAQEVREGCVAESLDLFQDLADRLAPLAYARSVDELVAGGCESVPDAEGHRLAFHGVPVRGSIVDLDLRVVLGNGGVAVDVLAVGPSSTTTGRLELTHDAELGIVVTGSLAATLADGHAVATDVGPVQGMLVADLPGLATGLVFTAGSVDVDVHLTGAPLARGSAALVGRVAVVALEVRGVHTHGEIALD
jgi:hypothetical protein